MTTIRPYLRRRQLGALASSYQTSYTPDQVAELYQFPKVKSGKDQSIAIIELGGGYATADITTYFSKLGLPAPHVNAVSVGGGRNQPGADPDADGEVMLDILVAAAAYSYSTGTPAQIEVFFAPQSGFADAIKAAAAHSSKPAVCSISWGGPENQWQASELDAMEAAFGAANAAGMTVLAAAGDNGSSDGERGKHADYPASSPNVLACGGTTLRASGASIQSERAWNDGSRGGATGGGFSVHFAKPAYQADVAGKMRGLPDLSGDADPYTGYVVIVDDKPQVIGGTSAVAPLMSALVAVLAKATGRRFGALGGMLYKDVSAFRDINLGNNGAFKASSGWDPATGLGVPVGSNLLAAMMK
jgi:kumamolisin